MLANLVHHILLTTARPAATAVGRSVVWPDRDRDKTPGPVRPRLPGQTETPRPSQTETARSDQDVPVRQRRLGPVRPRRPGQTETPRQVRPRRLVRSDRDASAQSDRDVPVRPRLLGRSGRDVPAGRRRPDSQRAGIIHMAGRPSDESGLFRAAACLAELVPPPARSVGCRALPRRRRPSPSDPTRRPINIRPGGGEFDAAAPASSRRAADTRRAPREAAASPPDAPADWV